MGLPFLTDRRETPASMRKKAEDLLARSEEAAIVSKGQGQTGENRLNRAGYEGDFRQFRDYRAEDRPQDIDWKRSARGDAVLVRERDKKQQIIFDIYLQDNQGMYFSSGKTSTKYETGGILATAFGLWAERNHNPVYFKGERNNAGELPFIILDAKTPPYIWKNNAVTILIGDYTDKIEDIELVLSGISSRQVIFFQVLDRAELELPFHGRHIFEDGQAKVVVNNTDAIRHDYQSALNSHIESLRAYCKKRGWHYALIRTDKDSTAEFSSALRFLEATK